MGTTGGFTAGGGISLRVSAPPDRQLKEAVVTRIQKAIAVAAAVGGLAWASSASAQIWTPPPAVVPPVPLTGVNNAFPAQNPQGPIGAAYQVNYPYPGQCIADPANAVLFPTLPACTGGSFSCPSQRTAGGWAACSDPLVNPLPIPFKVVAPFVPGLTTTKFFWDVLNPPDYAPLNNTTCVPTNPACPTGAPFPNADYYEIRLQEARGFQALAGFGAFPNPTLLSTCGATGLLPCPPVPDGMQWTGLTCNNLGNAAAIPPVPAGCTCPSDATPAFAASYCAAAGGRIPVGAPIYTPIWGVGSALNGPGPLSGVATWPSISIRANRGTPVVVKWVNDFPNNHVLCPHPEAADWPCAIDRTFMGVKATIDPAVAESQLFGVPPDGVNQYGSPQQPDNSWVTHLHGGEIPPSTDGFAEKWFGNATTAGLYNAVNKAGKPPFVTPPFENPTGLHLRRPLGNSDTYTYPMVQEEATIWFHDHTLGKTHHNVIAGPAGFFPIKDPAEHGALTAWTPGPIPAGSPKYTWLDPVTEIRGGLLGAIPQFDLFFAIQDRAFNDDGSINFSNGLGQTIPPPPAVLPPGYSPVTNGVNPLVHPTWVPEYFGEVALVNGVAWPKHNTQPGWYRIRLVDGSDSRCWTIGFQRAAAPPAPGANVSFNVPFYVLANDQGYLKAPFRPANNRVTMCPGERYELLVNFGALPGVAAGAAANVYMVNNAKAPFPNGISPQQGFGPDLNVIMAFNVNPIYGPGVKSCGAANAPAGLTWNPANMAANENKTPAPGSLIPAGFYQNICMPLNPSVVVDQAYPVRPVFPPPAGSIVRQVYLNEKVDGTTLAPLGMQLNGVPFEYKVTETPKNGTTEYWQFVNLTVDAHPMHPHLVAHKILARQTFNVGKYKAALCGSTTCQPGPAPGNEMQVVPDVTPFLTGGPTLVTDASVEGGPKDAAQAPPGFVTTIVADWRARWVGANGAPLDPGNAPGSAGCPNGTLNCPAVVQPDGTFAYNYESVTSGPYVWHCHINSHEDSEMMRTSLVVP